MIRTTSVLPEEIRQRFKNFINSRTGLYFKDYDIKDLDTVISQRMRERKIGTILTYYNYLTTSEQKEEELRELLNHLTVNHTYFFRNEPQFNAFKDKILPEIIARRSSLVNRTNNERRITNDEPIKPTLRIWSAGCSTGEEPYTIAMIMRDVIPDIENWDIQILATDVSDEALTAARKGIYGANSTQFVDAHHKAVYFTEKPGAEHGKKYAINDDIKRMVSLGFFNLMDDDYPQGFDVIFCRNVTIYFELETTIRVMSKFEQSLDKDGYFFIGYSETLQFISDKFKMVDWQDAIFYVKAHAAAARQERFVPRPKPPTPENIDQILQNISIAQFEADKKDLKELKKPSPRFDQALIEAIKAIHSKDYNHALSLIEEARSLEKNAVEPYYLAAEAYVNQGRFNEARENLKAALERNMMFAPAHYLFGSIYSEEGNKEEAEKSYRKSLYLDKEFSLSHFSLGNIYRETGKADSALREYRNALNILSKSKPYDILPYSGGFNVATLSSVCRNSIERLKAAH